MFEVHPTEGGGAVCDFGNVDADSRFGYLVDTPEIRTLIEETQQLMTSMANDADRVDALRPTFSKLLNAHGWLPEEYATPDYESGMGGGIGQYALYRAEDGSLCLFSLVVPAGASTPVHDHLAWGLIGVYQGEQAETIYERTDDGAQEGRAKLQVTKEIRVKSGEFYALLPPADDIHYVTTVSEGASVSLHLLANDTACVWRHSFDPDAGTVAAFRSGYSNAECPSEENTSPARN
jgi:predicted metal-dependent enzyme (double-stranded beta helix superfamily)